MTVPSVGLCAVTASAAVFPDTIVSVFGAVHVNAVAPYCLGTTTVGATTGVVGGGTVANVPDVCGGLVCGTVVTTITGTTFLGTVVFGWVFGDRLRRDRRRCLRLDGCVRRVAPAGDDAR